MNLLNNKATISEGNTSITVYGETANIVNAIVIATVLLVGTAIVVKALE